MAMSLGWMCSFMLHHLPELPWSIMPWSYLHGLSDFHGSSGEGFLIPSAGAPFSQLEPPAQPLIPGVRDPFVLSCQVHLWLHNLPQRLTWTTSPKLGV